MQDVSDVEKLGELMLLVVCSWKQPLAVIQAQLDKLAGHCVVISATFNSSILLQQYKHKHKLIPRSSTMS